MSIRRSLAAIAAGALLASLTQGIPTANASDRPDPLRDLRPAKATAVAGEKGPVVSLGEGSGPELYLVQLEAPAVPSRDTAAGGERLQSESAYRADLRGQQAELRAEITGITGARAKVRFTYTEAINGIAVQLTRDQARQVARLDGVAAVQVDFTRELNTDVGPEWIGAPSVWDGSSMPGGVGTLGEDVIVGVLDSGINPSSPSFADTVPVGDGGDGYDHDNPLGAGNYVGVCDSTEPSYIADWGCNDKLIGYWNFQGANPYDDDGHGSHTASTAAGNRTDATTYAAEGTDFEFSATENIKGVAPHANLIAYDVCDGSCQGSSILAGIDQAIEDGVDVINYSIGSPDAGSPWIDLDAQGFLNARAAGIHVATSAGNDGPGFATLGSPADTPWLTSVGATQHNRQWQATVQDLVSDGAPLADIQGVGFAAPTDGIFPLVYAGNLSPAAATCGAGPLAGFNLAGQVVVCDRGGVENGEPIGRVQKGVNVLARNAEGLILVNDVDSGDSLNADPHVLPAVHITYDSGQTLKAWMNSVTGEQAGLSGGQRHLGADVADMMAAFSSRGENRAVSMIGPSLSAPGVDVLAANGKNDAVEWGFISGTSMASPHIAGSLALLDSAQPAWTPAEAQSALMTTAYTEVTDDDGTEADWFDMGSGRVDLTKAVSAGFVLDESEAGYLAADPAAGGDVRTLNTASMADDQCLAECSWVRSLTGTETGEGEWDVTVESFSGDLTLEAPPTITLAEGDDASLEVTATVSPDSSNEDWLFGVVTLTPPAGSDAAQAHLPVAVLPTTGVLPESLDIRTRRDAGSQVVEDIESIAVNGLQLTPGGLTQGDTTALTVPEDSTNDNAFDGNGVVVTEIEVPAGATRLVARLDDPSSPDYDLYVGTGAVSEANVECMSADTGSLELCDVPAPGAGTWWVLVQNYEATTPGGSDTVDLVAAVVNEDEGNLSAAGPPGATIPAGTPYDVRVFWDEAELGAGEIWYGSITLGSSPGTPDDIGVLPVTVNRLADDVTKTADRATAAPGDTITYTVDIASNVTPEDLVYEIDDTLPAGTTYVPGSATGGATVTDGVVSWEGTLGKAQGVGSYDITTSEDDATCVNPITGAAGYYDLGEIDDFRDSDVSGDATAWTAFASRTYGLFGQSEQGLTFSDDGFLVYDPDANFGGNPAVPQVLPNPALPNNVAAPLWQDMVVEYDEAAGSGVALATTGDLAIIEYDDLVPKAGTPGQSYDVQIIATEDSSDLVFAYDNLTGPLGEVTVGVEDATGTEGTALVNKADASGVLADGLNVCLRHTAPVASTASFSYQVTVDAGVAFGAQLVNEALHVTDNPGGEGAVASATVTVAKRSSATTLSLNPTSIKTGGTTSATATVTSAAATKPTGQVQFLSGTTVLGTGALDATGKATATLSGFASAGTLPLTARFLGNATTEGSTSAPVNLVVSTTQPPAKVKPTIVIKTRGKVEVGTKPKVKIVVSAQGVTPTGAVEVKVKSGKKTKTYDAVLNARGKVKLTLNKAKKLGKLKVKVAYAGDAAVLSGTARTTIKVVPKK